ncbi:uncharacterized protein LOC123197373 [Mangifera indica]|uniref:uncharacterized protein LOC123197373 n=1 Tax=Mangifera indica TaxID=29780 RepID=UPI001CF9C7B7|nr:uncharacterized protein LOC123197373 [Mangifera indica]
MASIMEQQQRHDKGHHQHKHEHDPPDFNLREWALKARLSRDYTNSRRFSASHITSFREDAPSFRSNFTISSTASSPGYSLKEEIDPSTYSFTTALKALQARTAYNSWECLSPDGFALNSKWNEAEKYICNPLSGEFPMECLSAKTLSGRSFRNLTNRITMSAPLVYNSSHHSRNMQTNKPSSITMLEEDIDQFPIPESKMEKMTRDVGTQSTPPELSSASPSPASAPSIMEGSLKHCEAEGNGDSPISNAKIKFEEEVELKETRDKEETKGDNKEEMWIKKREGWCWRSSSVQGGCLSWMRKRHREKHKPRRNKHSIFLPPLKGC